MASAFLGLPVTIKLKSGALAQGTVVNIDTSSGIITLAPATIFHPNGQQSTFPERPFSRQEVETLKLISTERQTPPTSSHNSAGNVKAGLSAAAQSGPPTTVKAEGSSAKRSSSASHRSQSQQQQQHPQASTRATNDVYALQHLQATLPSSSDLDSPSEAESLPERDRSTRSSAGKGKRKKTSGAATGAGVRRERSALVQHVDQGDEADHSSAPYDDYARSSSQQQRNAQGPAPDEEFDFQGSSARFDKHREFAIIKSQDETDPSHRLVAHNRLPKHLAKLLPSENVLSPLELADQAPSSISASHPKPNTATADAHHYPSIGESSDETSDETDGVRRVPEQQQHDENVAPPLPPLSHDGGGVSSRKTSSSNNGMQGPAASQLMRGEGAFGRVAGGGGAAFVTMQGVRTPDVRLKQVKEALSIADIETGPTRVQMNENAGRGLASFILAHLCLHRRVLPLPPRVAVLLDDCDKAGAALRAGVHLLNRGAKVVACVLGVAGREQGEQYRTGLRVFSSAGGRIVRDLEDLSGHFDLVIDAMADPELQATMDPKSPAAIAASNWANSTGIPIMAIDSPFGTDADTGVPTAASFIRPTYVLCRGALRTGCRALTMAEIVLLDVGLPPSVWARVGVDEWDVATFGGEWVVPVLRA